MNKSPYKRGVALLMALTGGTLLAPVPADAAGELHFNTSMWSRTIETFAQIPAEATQGSPATIVQLKDPSVTNCEAWAGVYDLGVVLDEYLSFNDFYENPSRVLASNPPTRNPAHNESGSAPGPRAVADCTEPTAGYASATWGGTAGDQFGVESASSHSVAQRLPDDVLVNEGTTKLSGVTIGDASIRSLESWLRVEWRHDTEPAVSYRIVLQGLFNGTSELAAGGGQGLVLSGENVGGADLAQQFNEQAAAHRDALAALGTYGFHILGPRSYHDPGQRDLQPGGHIVEAPVLDANWGFTAREGQTGQRQGIRLGITRAVAETWQR